MPIVIHILLCVEFQGIEAWLIRYIIRKIAEIRSGKFAKYNYRTSAQNQRAYNRTLAPSYDLSLIPPSLPIFLVSGENDWFADKKNIQKLRANLPQDPTFLEVPKYAHFDLIFSESIAKDVYTPIIEYLQSGFRNWHFNSVQSGTIFSLVSLFW